MPLGLASLVPFAVLAVAAPFVLRAAPPGAPRRWAGAVLAALGLAHAGFYLLYVSTVACWTLVGLAGCVLAAAAFPARARLAAGVAGAAGLALGLAFEATPGDVGLVLYVGAAGPLLLLATLAMLAARVLARDAGGPTLAAGAALVAFAALIPLTSFVPSFLLTFEPVHAPVLAAALAGAWLVGRAWRTPPPAAPGEVAARPALPPRLAPALRAAAGALAVLAAPRDAFGLALATVAVGLALAPRAWAGVALSAAALVLAAEAALDLHVRGGTLPELRLAAACVAAGCAALAAAVHRARGLDAAAREDALARRPGYGALRVEAALPGVGPAELEAFRARGGGVLEVRAPDDPFWSLRDDAYAWLLAQPPGGARVHVAVVERDATSLVPPRVEVEG